MTVTVTTTKEYILQGIPMPKVIGSIIDDYTSDLECTFSDGRKEYLKNKDVQNFDFKGVKIIVVYTQLIISRKVNFRCLANITGDGKVILVGDMSNMFRDAYNFNSDISGWDVSNVTDMSNMFYRC